MKTLNMLKMHKQKCVTVENKYKHAALYNWLIFSSSFLILSSLYKSISQISCST